MRSVLCLSVLALVTAACSSSSGDGGSGSNGGGNGDGDGPGNGDTIACTAGFSDELFHATTNKSSRFSVATGDGLVGVAYSDATGVVQLGVVAADGSTSTFRATGNVDRSKYGDYGVRLAYNKGKFGVGFDSERKTSFPNDPDPSGWPSASFATVDASTGKASLPTVANNDLDRSDDRQPVQAGASTPIPTADGFFVAWSDTRTAEPVPYDVNAAYYSGIYGMPYGLDGKASTYDDVQVEQNDIPFGFAGVATSKGILTAWGGRNSDSNEAWLYTRLGPTDGEFTIAEPGAPIAKWTSAGSAKSGVALTGALGADGNVLFVFETRDSTQDVDSLSAVLVDGKGALVSNNLLATAKGTSFSLASIATTPNGYDVAYASTAAPAASPVTFDTVHLVSVDASGNVDNTRDPAAAVDGGNVQSLAASVDADGIARIYVASGAAPALSLRSLTVCP